MSLPDFKQFTLHIGDEFLFEKDQKHPRRVVINVGEIGDFAISAAVPALNSSGREYFVVNGSTHPVTSIHSVVDRWSIDRLIAAHRLGLDERFGMLPRRNRERLSKEFAGRLALRTRERLITIDDLLAAYHDEQKYSQEESY